MKRFITPRALSRVLLFVIAMTAILLAPPGVAAYTCLLALAYPVYSWVRGSFDVSLSPGDRSINRVLAVMAAVVITDWCLRLLR
jgi:hypothetical protein